jgi:hypothetical protein
VGTEPIDSLAAIVATEATYGWKAERCLSRVSELPWDDAAKPELLAAAQTFALLDIANSLRSNSDTALADLVQYHLELNP